MSASAAALAAGVTAGATSAEDVIRAALDRAREFDAQGEVWALNRVAPAQAARELDAAAVRPPKGRVRPPRRSPMLHR